MADRTQDAVVVLGAGGFLGPHLVRAAFASGAPRVTGVRRSAGMPPGLGAREGFTVHRAELTARGVVEGILDVERPCTVLLGAALSRVDACARDAEHGRRSNVELPERVARWCARHGARLVHISTDLVFGARPPAGRRYTEDDDPSPVHEYGRTKAAGEQAVLAAAPDALVVRLPLLYGDSAGEGLGASDSLLAALARGETPRLFHDEWRTPLDAAVAAAAVVEAARQPIAGVLHVAGPRRLSRYELGLEVLRAHGLPTGVDAPLERCAQADADLADSRPSDVSLDVARAVRLLTTRLTPPEHELIRPCVEPDGPAVANAVWTRFSDLGPDGKAWRSARFWCRCRPWRAL